MVKKMALTKAQRIGEALRNKRGYHPVIEIFLPLTPGFRSPATEAKDNKIREDMRRCVEIIRTIVRTHNGEVNFYQKEWGT